MIVDSHILDLPKHEKTILSFGITTPTENPNYTLLSKAVIFQGKDIEESASARRGTVG